LPGSRKQEINTLLPVMLETARNFPEEQFIITGISGLRALYPDSFPDNVTLVFDSTYKMYLRWQKQPLYAAARQH
jgi:lipid-A-disaccharide synthase